MEDSILRLAIYKFSIIIFILLYFSEASEESKPSDSISEVRKTTETNIFNFFRLFILRMVYGFASMVGLGDFLEDFAGGIFVPPNTDYGGLDYGADADDYKEYDDYDY